MEVVIVRQVTIDLKMNEIEAAWLQDFVKNPHTEENQLDSDMKHAIVNSLNNARSECEKDRRIREREGIDYG